MLVLLASVILAGGFLWKESLTNDALAVSQLDALGDTAPGHWVKVKGKVEANSVVWDAKSKQVKFALTDGQDRLTVVYQGDLPDGFKPGTDLVVEGQHRSGQLEASRFLTNSLCNVCHS